MPSLVVLAETNRDRPAMDLVPTIEVVGTLGRVISPILRGEAATCPQSPVRNR